jgi:hypothetical protein
MTVGLLLPFISAVYCILFCISFNAWPLHLFLVSLIVICWTPVRGFTLYETKMEEFEVM